MSKYVHVHIYMFVYLHLCIHARTYRHFRIHDNTSTYLYKRTYTHTHTNVCMPTYISIHTWYRVAKTHRCLKLHVIFRKRATNYRALLRKMTYTDEASSHRSCTLHITIEKQRRHTREVVCSNPPNPRPPHTPARPRYGM